MNMKYNFPTGYKRDRKGKLQTKEWWKVREIKKEKDLVLQIIRGEKK